MGELMSTPLYSVMMTVASPEALEVQVRLLVWLMMAARMKTALVMAFVALVVLRTSLQFPSAGFVIVTAPATVGFQVTQAICTPLKLKLVLTLIDVTAVPAAVLLMRDTNAIA